jgi:hypothetical protein
MNRFKEISDSRFALLGRQILILATSGQRCDVTFFKHKPAIDVTLDEQLALAVMACCSGPETFYEILQDIRLSNGTTVNINDIWTINAMPKKGFTEEELEAVDMSQAEERIGPNGATLRKMIKDTYHCGSRDQEDYYLRRFIAS